MIENLWLKYFPPVAFFISLTLITHFPGWHYVALANIVLLAFWLGWAFCLRYTQRVPDKLLLRARRERHNQEILEAAVREAERG